jgi:hypothetical protein
MNRVSQDVQGKGTNMPRGKLLVEENRKNEHIQHPEGVKGVPRVAFVRCVGERRKDLGCPSAQWSSTST